MQNRKKIVMCFWWRWRSELLNKYKSYLVSLFINFDKPIQIWVKGETTGGGTKGVRLNKPVVCAPLFPHTRKYKDGIFMAFDWLFKGNLPSEKSMKLYITCLERSPCSIYTWLPFKNRFSNSCICQDKFIRNLKEWKWGGDNLIG